MLSEVPKLIGLGKVSSVLFDNLVSNAKTMITNAITNSFTKDMESQTLAESGDEIMNKFRTELKKDFIAKMHPSTDEVRVLISAIGDLDDAFN
ncbi:MAG: hypothetical protein JXR48_06940 [Candidatus Delongbacteria bacterium]|nr:hypothetical protein [Candidatus Delongbacteria bacterium]